MNQSLGSTCVVFIYKNSNDTSIHPNHSKRVMLKHITYVERGKINQSRKQKDINI